MQARASSFPRVTDPNTAMSVGLELDNLGRSRAGRSDHHRAGLARRPHARCVHNAQPGSAMDPLPSALHRLLTTDTTPLAEGGNTLAVNEYAT